MFRKWTMKWCKSWNWVLKERMTWLSNLSKKGVIRQNQRTHVPGNFSTCRIVRNHNLQLRSMKERLSNKRTRATNIGIAKTVIKDLLMTRLKLNNCLRTSIWINYSTEEVCSRLVELNLCRWMPQRRRRGLRYLTWCRSKSSEHLQSTKRTSSSTGTKVSSNSQIQCHNSQPTLWLTQQLLISSATTKPTKLRTKSTIHIWPHLKKCWNQLSKEVQTETPGNRKPIAPWRLAAKIGPAKVNGSESRTNNNAKSMPEMFSTRSNTLEPITEQATTISQRPIKAAKGCRRQGTKQLLRG